VSKHFAICLSSEWEIFLFLSSLIHSVVNGLKKSFPVCGQQTFAPGGNLDFRPV